MAVLGSSTPIKSIQRGTTSVTRNTSSTTATINAVTTGNTMVNVSTANGFSAEYVATIGAGNAVMVGAVLTNTTTLTFTAGTGVSGYTALGSAVAVCKWEVIEYV